MFYLKKMFFRTRFNNIDALGVISDWDKIGTASCLSTTVAHTEFIFTLNIIFEMFTIIYHQSLNRCSLQVKINDQLQQ